MANEQGEKTLVNEWVQQRHDLLAAEINKIAAMLEAKDLEILKLQLENAALVNFILTEFDLKDKEGVLNFIKMQQECDVSKDLNLDAYKLIAEQLWEDYPNKFAIFSAGLLLQVIEGPKNPTDNQNFMKNVRDIASSREQVSIILIHDPNLPELESEDKYYQCEIEKRDSNINKNLETCKMMLPDLLKKYPGQYAAFNSGELLGVLPTLKEITQTFPQAYIRHLKV